MPWVGGTAAWDPRVLTPQTRDGVSDGTLAT